MMEILFIVLLCSIVASMIGSRKGCACSSFFIGLLLGPLGIVIVLLMRGNRKTCRYCCSMIPLEALTCYKCGKDLCAIIAPSRKKKIIIRKN